VWKQGEGTFMSVCQNCETIALVSIAEDWSPPMEQLTEDWLVTGNRLLYGIVHKITRLFSVVVAKIKARFRRSNDI